MVNELENNLHNPRHVIDTEVARHMHGRGNFNRIHKRVNVPIYNDKADYDTNAQSYYDYLARVNEYLGTLTDVVNKLFKRDLTTLSTLSVDMDKIGDWIASGQCANMLNGDDVVTITDFVKMTTETKQFSYKGYTYTLKNCLDIMGSSVADSGKEGDYTPEGMYSKDYDELLKRIIDDVLSIKVDIENILKLGVHNTSTINMTGSTTGSLKNGTFSIGATAIFSKDSDNMALTGSDGGIYVPTPSDPPPAYLDNIMTAFPYNVANSKDAGIWKNKLQLIGVNVKKRGLRKVTCTFWADNPGQGTKKDIELDLQINNSGGGLALPVINIPSSWSGILHVDNPRFTN